MAVLWIGGTAMPDPKLGGLTVSREKIWSANAGRGTDGTMVGDLVAIKDTLKITWPCLTDAQVATIDSAVSGAFFTVKYKSPNANAYVEKTMYAGTPSYPVYSYVNGVKTYNGVSVTLIEV